MNRKNVLRKVAVFYSQVTMPCVIIEPNELLPNTKKPKHIIIPNFTHKALNNLIKRTWNYKKAVAIVSILEKSAHLSGLTILYPWKPGPKDGI
ncbi:hypothetical protein DSO57_1021301 [Entomophthora muscae]|uniref:Uncharacterized protein n=1 Tax=Entomophthora muscae TaxID=34485 RepID=A0ACC2TQE8_9FUNG|nr:hypothetical protein DSO57_1021301 [Entomophthora muscae]